MFPFIKKDLENWQTLGSAVFLTNKVVLTPEAINRKGIIHTTKPLSKDHTRAWVAIVDVEISSKEENKLGSGGLGIYYVRNLDEKVDMSSPFGFTNKFDGAAVVVNTGMRTKDKTTN